MMALARRPERIAEAIREEVAMFLAEDVKDPRVRGLVTVTGAEVTRDLHHAKVFVTVMGSMAEQAATFEGLESAAHHLRTRIGRALRLRVAPEIEFKPDRSVAYAARIESLLESIRPADMAGPDASEADATEASGGGARDASDADATGDEGNPTA